MLHLIFGFFTQRHVLRTYVDLFKNEATEIYRFSSIVRNEIKGREERR